MLRKIPKLSQLINQESNFLYQALLVMLMSLYTSRPTFKIVLLNFAFILRNLFSQIEGLHSKSLSTKHILCFPLAK